MKVSGLKRIIKVILNEVRRVGPGEFVEPNGTVHDVEDSTHWEWALKYVGDTSRFDTLNPLRELLKRGWVRVIYSYHDSIIMVEHHTKLTKQQMAYLEDQAEQTRWAVVDDDGVEIYRSSDCITKENPLGEVTQKDLKSTMPPIRAWNIKKVPNKPTQQTPKMDMMTLDNLKALKDKAGRSLLYLKKNKPEEYKQYGPLIFKQWQSYDWEIKRRLKRINEPIRTESTEPSIGGSYLDQATNVEWDDITQMERDPLNDPELNGKLNESSYKFDEYGWLSTMDGFNKPVDVYYGTILLGVIESRPDGYVIIVVIGPDKHYRIDAGPDNKFKTKIDAAEALHRTWKTLRTKQA